MNQIAQNNLMDKAMKRLSFYNFFDGMWVLSSLLVVYFEQVSNSYTIAMSVFSIRFIFQFLLEIPTSVFSDKFSRKANLVIGQVFFVFASLLFALAGSFDSILLLYFGGALWGVSVAFYSGSHDALLYETLKDNGQENDYDVYYAKLHKYQHLGLIISIFFAAFISYFYDLTCLAYVAFAFSLCYFISAILLIESTSKPQEKENSIKHIILAIRRLIRKKKLRSFAFLSMINNSDLHAISRFEAAYFSLFVSDWLITIIKLIKHICEYISFSVVHRFKKYNPLSIVIGSNLGIIITRILALVMNNIVSPFLISLGGVFEGTTQTAQSHILQKEYSRKQRATMDSIISLFNSLFASIMFVIIGYIADLYSPVWAMATLVVVKIFVVIGYKNIFKKYG